MTTNDYIVRFNTKNNGDASKVWRIFENGVEHQVAGVNILGPSWDIVTQEGEETKWNLGTKGSMHVDSDGIATITRTDYDRARIENQKVIVEFGHDKKVELPFIAINEVGHVQFNMTTEALLELVYLINHS